MSVLAGARFLAIQWTGLCVGPCGPINLHNPTPIWAAATCSPPPPETHLTPPCSLLPAPPKRRHLEYKRAGGRSSARFGDTVRRRLWRRKPGSSATEAPAVAASQGADSAAAALVAAVGAEEGTGAALGAAALQAAREAAAKQKAIKAFLAMVLDALR